jgi:hypothetical protein
MSASRLVLAAAALMGAVVLVGAELTFPNAISSVDGSLTTTITVEEYTLTMTSPDITLRTRG